MCGRSFAWSDVSGSRMQLNTPDARNMSTRARANMQISRMRVGVRVRKHVQKFPHANEHVRANMQISRAREGVCVRRHTQGAAGYPARCSFIHRTAPTHAHIAYEDLCAYVRMWKSSCLDDTCHSGSNLSTCKRRLAELAHACGCMRKKARARCGELSRSLMRTRAPTCRAHARVGVYA